MRVYLGMFLHLVYYLSDHYEILCVDSLHRSRGGLGVKSSGECWCLIPCNIMADMNSDVVEWQSHPRNIRLIENECHLQINPHNSQTKPKQHTFPTHGALASKWSRHQTHNLVCESEAYDHKPW